MNNNDYVNSVLKASEILICVCRGERKLSDIARKLKLNKTTVFRILNSLEQKGIVAKDQMTRSYYPGPFLQNLSIDAGQVHDLLTYLVSDEMESLCHAIDETVLLVVAYESLWLVLKVIRSYHKMAFSSSVGDSGPIYTGALGKILLAQFPEEELNKLLKTMILMPYTKTTTTNKLDLIEELKEIREKECVITFGEYIEGGAAIGVPIHHYSCPAGLIAVGYEVSMPKKTDLIVKHLTESRKRIESRLLEVTRLS